MGHSGKARHRDRNPGHRQADAEEPVPTDRLFRIDDADRQQIAACLRDIDEARRLLESQRNVQNREIIRALRAAADTIYEVLDGLEEVARAPE